MDAAYGGTCILVWHFGFHLACAGSAVWADSLCDFDALAAMPYAWRPYGFGRVGFSGRYGLGAVMPDRLVVDLAGDGQVQVLGWLAHCARASPAPTGPCWCAIVLERRRRVWSPCGHPRADSLFIIPVP
jgi:hypothetical protein